MNFNPKLLPGLAYNSLPKYLMQKIQNLKTKCVTSSPGFPYIINVLNFVMQLYDFNFAVDVTSLILLFNFASSVLPLRLMPSTLQVSTLRPKHCHKTLYFHVRHVTLCVQICPRILCPQIYHPTLCLQLCYSTLCLQLYYRALCSHFAIQLCVLDFAIEFWVSKFVLQLYVCKSSLCNFISSDLPFSFRS